MKKEKIKNIILIIVVAVISSTITSFATSNYLYDSIDVKYDNSNGVQAETVQGAIDELYSCASDYSGIDTRLTSVEGYFQNNPTSYFDGNSLIIGDNSSSGERVIHLFDSNSTLRSTFGLTTSGETIINARNSSGQSTKGTLSLYGNPVQINGVEVHPSYFFKKIEGSVSDINTLSITYPERNYRHFNGILFTRYSMYYINMQYGTSTTPSVKVIQLGNNGIDAETIVVTISGNVVSLKSNNGWNNFVLCGVDSLAPSDIILSGSST